MDDVIGPDADAVHRIGRPKQKGKGGGTERVQAYVQNRDEAPRPLTGSRRLRYRSGRRARRDDAVVEFPLDYGQCASPRWMAVAVKALSHVCMHACICICICICVCVCMYVYVCVCMCVYVCVYVYVDVYVHVGVGRQAGRQAGRCLSVCLSVGRSVGRYVPSDWRLIIAQMLAHMRPAMYQTSTEVQQELNLS